MKEIKITMSTKRWTQLIIDMMDAKSLMLRSNNEEYNIILTRETDEYDGNLKEDFTGELCTKVIQQGVLNWHGRCSRQRVRNRYFSLAEKYAISLDIMYEDLAKKEEEEEQS